VEVAVKKILLIIVFGVLICEHVYASEEVFYPHYGAVFAGDAVYATGQSVNDEPGNAYKMALIDALTAVEEALVGVNISMRSLIQESQTTGSDRTNSYHSHFSRDVRVELRERFPFHYVIVNVVITDDVARVTVRVSAKEILVAQAMRYRIGLTEDGYSGVMCPDTLDYTVCEHISLALIKDLEASHVYLNPISSYWFGFKTNTFVTVNDECEVDQLGEMISLDDPGMCDALLTVEGNFVIGKGDSIVRKYALSDIVCDLPQGADFQILHGYPFIDDDQQQKMCTSAIIDNAQRNISAFIGKTIHNR
jgi:hypothetical protein